MMPKTLYLILALALGGPLMAEAQTITLLPSVSIQIGDYDGNGHYWDGDRWRDRDWWNRHYAWRDNRWYRHDAGWHGHRPPPPPPPHWHGGGPGHGRPGGPPHGGPGGPGGPHGGPDHHWRH